MIFVLMGVPPLEISIDALHAVIVALDERHSRNMDRGHTLVAPEETIRDNRNSRIRNAVQSRQDVWDYASLYAWVHRRNVEKGNPLGNGHCGLDERTTYITIRESVRASIADAGMPASRRARDTVNVAEWHSIYDVPPGIDHSAGRREWIDWCRDLDRDCIENVKAIGRTLTGYTPEMKVKDGSCRFRLRPNVPGAKPETMLAEDFYRYMVRMAAGLGTLSGTDLAATGDAPLPFLPRPPRRMMI